MSAAVREAVTEAVEEDLEDKQTALHLVWLFLNQNEEDISRPFPLEQGSPGHGRALQDRRPLQLQLRLYQKRFG